MRIASPLIRIPLAYTLVSLVISCIYVFMFGYSLAAIPSHGIMVLAYSAFCVSIAYLIHNLFGASIATSSLIFLIFLIFNLILATAYTANFISSLFWSAPMYDALLLKSIGLLLEYYYLYFSHTADFKALITSKNFGFLFKSLTVGIPVLVIELSLITFLAIRVTNALIFFGPTKRSFSIFAKVLLAGIFCILIIPHVVASIYAKNNWRGEMITDSLLNKNSYAYPDIYRDKIAENDRKSFAAINPKTHNPPNIVLVIADALRGNFIYDPEHPPAFITRLLNEQKLQRLNGFSICPNTTCGILGIMTSKDITRIHSNSVAFQEILQKAGYTNIGINAGLPNWYGLKEYARTFDYYFDTDNTNSPKMSDEIITKVLPQLNFSNNQPFFMYVRMMSTHEYGQLNTTDWVSRYEYATRVWQMDTYLEKIFDALKAQGVLDNTIVLVTGDHGESLGEKGERGHNISLYYNQINTPLLIYDQNRTYPTDKIFYSLDIAPTILDLAGISAPDFMEGLSLLKKIPEERIFYHARVDVLYQAKIRGITHIKKDGKIYEYLATGAKKFSLQENREELYELRSDPEENNNLISTASPEMLTFYRNKLSEHFRD